jgi:PAS domain S-box-containing protein
MPTEDVNILILDEDRQSRHGLETMLSGPGQKVIPAKSGKEALDYLLQHDAAVVLLKTDGETVNAFETAKQIRERVRTARVPIVFIAPPGGEDGRLAEAYAMGGIDYIFSPVNPAILRSKVAAFVELYRSTRAVRRQNDFVVAVLDTIESLVLVLDSNGRIQRVNKAWEDTMGYAGDEVSGKPINDFMVGSSEDHDDFFQQVRTETEFEDSWTTKSGELRRIAWRRTIRRGGPGRREETYLIVTGNDVTERMRLDQERRARAEELEGFTYSVSHDLRAPVRAIDGFTQILSEEYASQIDEEGQRILHIVRVNTQKMGELIDGLLALSRIGREPMRSAEVDMVELANSIFEDQRATIDPAREIAFHADDDLPPAYGDKRLIAQVFENLISNAMKFTRNRKPAVIEVGYESLAGDTVYFVRDNGVGFDMTYVHKLFGTFQRLHAVTEFEGTGIGLATVRRIIQRHGGEVWAKSEEGGGATFYFSLPRQEMKKAG